VFEDSPYNVSHARIQEKFGGVEPLIIVAEGKDRDAMKRPAHAPHDGEVPALPRTRPRRLATSFSLTDILRT